MDLWASLAAVKMQLTPSLFDSADKWLGYAINAPWPWFLLAMLGALWISRRLIVVPLAQLIEERREAGGLEDKLHILTKELKQMRLLVDELRAKQKNIKQEHAAIEELRALGEEFRLLLNSSRDERDKSEEFRSAMHEICAVLISLKGERDERTEELRSGLDSLIYEYEEARAD